MSVRFSRAKSSAFVVGSSDGGSLAGDIYVANLNTGETSVFSGSSALIWEILETPQTLEQLISETAEVYGVSEGTVAEGVSGFLDLLQNQGLVEPSAESPQ